MEGADLEAVIQAVLERWRAMSASIPADAPEGWPVLLQVSFRVKELRALEQAFAVPEGGEGGQ